MRCRSIAIRVVLIVAALASVATSPPEGYVLSDSGTIELSGPATIRAYARANAAAFEHADAFQMELRITAEAGQTLTLIPDDPSRPIVEAVLPNGTLQHFLSLHFGDTCRSDGNAGCELGVSIDIPESAAITVTATGQASALGDPSFFFPEDRDFPADAAVEVGFDE
jgi:hypothetical protein